ncbi:MAG: hypothetical protein IJP48_07370 [Synergistaceae bacterium]|nr:hypothetical protein [Synergistaceae bacterium]
MNRKVLLLEPPYKNKYPPLGLMKLASYFRICGDDVRFFKGSMRDLALDLFLEEFFADINNKSFGRYINNFREYIKTGRTALLDSIPDFYDLRRENTIINYRKRFRFHDFPKFDIIAVTTLFTFCWKEITETINDSKNFIAPSGRLLIGGIAASLVPDELYHDTGIKPITGLLDKPGIIDSDRPEIIDNMTPDYSILDEIDYVYPSSDSYFAYTTRGCIRHCKFCAVPVLEPEYKDFIRISDNINYINQHFGLKRDLLLMDNNVLASARFDDVIDEIKTCGFAKNASYMPPNEYEIAINNLRENYNPRACIRKIIRLYDKAAERLKGREAGEFYIFREQNFLLYYQTASPEAILNADKYFRAIYNKLFKPVKRSRYIDFNQGIDARLINDSNMSRLAEVNIRPLRIAFDHYAQREIYINAVRTAARHGIDDLSNYLLYNFTDRPEELYYRLKINVELCEELDVNIYSFPMKYHPVREPEYFRNRDYIGTNWNRKFIRAVQAVMNSTKGKIGRGKNFFEEAFGRDINEFFDILYMPETFIIYRMKYKASLTQEWRAKFHALTGSKLLEAKELISQNNFSDEIINNASCSEVKDILRYYMLERE